MEVKLTDITAGAEGRIAEYAAICYDSKTDADSNDRRIKNLLKLKHLATLRFAYATFKVSDISRACSHQLVRHPHLSYLQRSQRYCSESKQGYVFPPNYSIGFLDDEEAEVNHIFDEVEMIANWAYRSLIKHGYKKGDARYVLPQAVTTELYVTGNFQAWYDFLSKRTDKAAQWEIRYVAVEIAKELSVYAPNIFGGFVDAAN